MKDYITLKQAAELTGKHVDTLRALIKKNKGSTLKDEKGRVLVSVSLLQSHYPQTGQVDDTTDKATTDATKQATGQGSTTTDSLIKALTDELQAKNTIIKQQQETIQKIVDQQQQLTGLLMSSNTPNAAEKSDKTTPVNSIEDIVTENKVKEKKENKKKNRKAKQHWWSKKK